MNDKQCEKLFILINKEILTTDEENQKKLLLDLYQNEQNRNDYTKWYNIQAGII